MRLGLLAGIMGLLASVVGGLAGCSAASGDDDEALAASSPIPDRGADETADLPKDGSLRLRVVSEMRVRLGFEQDTTIRAKVTDLKNKPVEGVPVRFALLGRAQDSSLLSLEVPTDKDGIASSVLMAGQQVAAFTVRVWTPGAYEQLIDVGVSDAGFGTLSVTAHYEGARAVAERVVLAKAGVDCDELIDTSGDPMVRLGEGQDEAQFLALPAGDRYAVIAYAESMDGVVLAQGCSDGISILADRATMASVEFDDEPIAISGAFTLNVVLDANMPAQVLMGVLRSTANASVVNDANGQAAMVNAEGRFLLDSLDATLRSDAFVGQPTALEFADALLSNRTTYTGPDSLDQALQLLLDHDHVGALSAVEQAVALTTPWVERVGLDAELTIEADGKPGQVTWLSQRLTALGGPADATPIALDLAVESQTRVEGTAELLEDSDQLELHPLDAPAPLGALTAQVARRVMGLDSMGSGEEIRAAMGCATLSAWLAQDPLPQASACGPDCVAAVCDRAVARLLGASETALLALDQNHTGVTLQSVFDLGDKDGDLLAERISSDVMSGVWITTKGVEGDEADTVSGTAMGTALPAEMSP